MIQSKFQNQKMNIVRKIGTKSNYINNFTTNLNIYLNENLQENDNYYNFLNHVQQIKNNKNNIFYDEEFK